MPVNFSLSTSAYDAIVDFIQDAGLDADCLNQALGHVVDSGERFIKTFEGTDFLKDEPVHEFEAIILRHETDLQQKRILNLRMTIRPNTVYVFSPSEVKVDEMYDVRKCIAESRFPCYSQEF